MKLVLLITNEVQFFLLTVTIFPAVTNYLQMSPGSGTNFFLIFAKWSKYTHIKALSTSLCSFIKPQSTLPSPPLFHQEDATEKYLFSNYSGNIYLHLHVLLFHFIVSWFSEMRFGVIHLEAWGSSDLYVAFLTFVFCSCFFVFGTTHAAPNSLTVHELVSVFP